MVVDSVHLMDWEGNWGLSSWSIISSFGGVGSLPTSSDVSGFKLVLSEVVEASSDDVDVLFDSWGRSPSILFGLWDSEISAGVCSVWCGGVTLMSSLMGELLLEGIVGSVVFVVLWLFSVSGWSGELVLVSCGAFMYPLSLGGGGK